MTKMQKALEALLYRIAQGRECPDVIGKIAAKFKVREDALARALDEFDGEWPEAPDDTPCLPPPPWAYK
jgi:hypothetical protein